VSEQPEITGGRPSKDVNDNVLPALTSQTANRGKRYIIYDDTEQDDIDDCWLSAPSDVPVPLVEHR